jgi:acylphosphatase
MYIDVSCNAFEMNKHPSEIQKQSQLQQSKIQVHGLVQGVNFRYLFKRHAYRNRLKGKIWNDPEDENYVHIVSEGSISSIDRFLLEIDRYRKMNMFWDGMAPVTSLIEVDSVDVIREEISQFSFDRFEIHRPELQNSGQVLLSILEKLSMGGALYQRFHEDHNMNFQTLDERYLRIHEGMERANRTLQEMADAIRT